ncbi:MAG: hypothetical protein WD045_08205 [Pirellulaceae bacterium]
MVKFRRPHPDDVEQLMINAQLRDELEPFFDESLQCLDSGRIPIRVENEFLSAILAWERAPVLPIRQWFSPALDPPAAETLSAAELHDQLWQMIAQLATRRVFLDYTDHLSDRQLYCLVVRDILPSQEKMIDIPNNALYYNCAQPDEDPETWLRYYATDEERHGWEQETGEPSPPRQASPHPRKMPGAAAR